jgi:hypothetical protein
MCLASVRMNLSNISSNQIITNTMADQHTTSRAHPSQKSPVASGTQIKTISHPPEAPSSISELQTAFGTMLLARKEKPQLPSPPILPRWTGSFALSSFPRELRDRIYYHYLYRPSGVVYRCSTSRTTPFDQPEHTTALFLTCRQVYNEALQVFCRHNIIDISDRNIWQYRHRIQFGNFLENTLRLFPDKAARLVQRVNKEYCMWQHIKTTPGDEFVQILRDAQIFRESFPKLREFRVEWKAAPYLFESQVKLWWLDSTSAAYPFAVYFPEEKNVELWLVWMRKWIGEKKVVPPRGLKFVLSLGMERHTGSINIAYAKLLGELALVRYEWAELEDSGKNWLEETSAEGKKRRPKKGLKSGN